MGDIVSDRCKGDTTLALISVVRIVVSNNGYVHGLLPPVATYGELSSALRCYQPLVKSKLADTHTQHVICGRSSVIVRSPATVVIALVLAANLLAI